MRSAERSFSRSVFRALLLVCVPALAATCPAQPGARPGQPQRSPGPPPNVEVIRDVVYGTGGGRDLRLHIARPRERPVEPMPTVVFIHGGGWRNGRPDPARNFPLAARGYFTVAVEYRLSGEATFPAQIEDCKAAIRWLRANAATYNLDPDRIGVWGSSAGGHLAALLGTSIGVAEFEGQGGNPEQSSAVQCVVDLFGPADLTRIGDAPSSIRHTAPTSPESQLIGGPLLDNLDKARAASPVTYIDGTEPPFLIFHGEQDMVVPFNQSEILHDALKQAGVDVTFVPVRNGGHGFGPGCIPSPTEINDMIAAFFDRCLTAR